MQSTYRFFFIIIIPIIIIISLSIEIGSFLKKPNHISNKQEIINNLIKDDNLNQVFEEKITIRVQHKDTLENLLKKAGVYNIKERNQILQVIKRYFNIHNLRIGQNLNFIFEKNNKDSIFKKLTFRSSIQEIFSLIKESEDSYKVKIRKIQLYKVVRYAIGNIESSFYATAIKKGVPLPVIREIMRALSYEIDLKHKSRDGDYFKIIYEVYEDEQGNFIKQGDLQYIYILPIIGKKAVQMYKYKTRSGILGYYSREGFSFAKSFLKTPLDLRRIRVSSRFNYKRLHPILGYNKAHKGVDYAVPYGTVVHAAGEGKIIKAGYYGNYGKYILIQHTNGYQTAYAHLSVISVRVGYRVKQGEPIGRVGNTGLSTGPHLHHEVIYKGLHVDPQNHSVCLPLERLASKEFRSFQNICNKIDFYLKKIYERERKATKFNKYINK